MSGQKKIFLSGTVFDVFPDGIDRVTFEKHGIVTFSEHKVGHFQLYRFYNYKVGLSFPLVANFFLIFPDAGIVSGVLLLRIRFLALMEVFNSNGFSPNGVKRS